MPTPTRTRTPMPMPMPMPMLDRVEEASEALAAGDAAAALEVLLALWRETRAPAIADAIDRVGARIPIVTDEVRMRGRDGAAARRWMEVCAANRAEDAGRLLATLTDGAAGVAAKYLRVLARRPADPRVARALAEHVASPPYRTSSAARFYARAIDLVEELRDVRALAILPRDASPVNARRRTSADGMLDAYLPGARERLLEVQAQVAPLSEEQLARLAALAPEPAPPPSDVAPPRPARALDELIAAVLDAPGDDAPRLVLADALQEIGDPRGELIALQVERARRGDKPTRREGALLREHGRAWLGELGDLVHAKGVRFERGFLAACRVSTDGALPASPMWRTVEELHLREATGRERQIDALLAMPSLRVLSGVVPQVATALAEAKAPPPLRSLSFGVIPYVFAPSSPESTLHALASPRCRLRLQRLAVIARVEPALTARLLEQPAGAELEELVVSASLSSAAAWIEAIDARAALASRLQTLELRSLGHLEDDLVAYRVILRREGGRFVAMAGVGPYGDARAAKPDAIAALAAQLGLPLRMFGRTAQGARSSPVALGAP